MKDKKPKHKRESLSKAIISELDNYWALNSPSCKSKNYGNNSSVQFYFSRKFYQILWQNLPYSSDNQSIPHKSIDSSGERCVIIYSRCIRLDTLRKLFVRVLNAENWPSEKSIQIICGMGHTVIVGELFLVCETLQESSNRLIQYREKLDSEPENQITDYTEFSQSFLVKKFRATECVSMSLEYLNRTMCNDIDQQAKQILNWFKIRLESMLDSFAHSNEHDNLSAIPARERF